MTPREKLAKARDLLAAARVLVQDVYALGMAGEGRRPTLVVDCLGSATDEIGAALTSITEASEQGL